MRILYLLFSATILLLASCIQDKLPITDPAGEKAAVLISISSAGDSPTRGYGDTDPDDDAVERLRVLIFHSGGTLAYNVIKNISTENPFKLVLEGGNYDFVFIGNEDYKADSPVTVALEALTKGISTISALDNISFPAEAFSRAARIPASAIYKNVEIIADNEYKLNGMPMTGVWQVELKRLGVRLDLKVIAESEARKNTLSELHLLNIPKAVPLLENNSANAVNYNGGKNNSQSAPIVVKIEDGDNNGQFIKNPQTDLYEWTVSRIILPSSVFLPDDEDNAVTMEAYFTTGQKLKAAFETSLNVKYQVPRNTYFLINAAMKSELELTMQVIPWGDSYHEVPVGIDRSLNVSDFTAVINMGTRKRIWFSSNMPEVVVLDTTSSRQQTNDIFKDLAGVNATNFYYEYDELTGKGAGHIDIMASDNYSSGGGSYSIYLNAKGLRREIKVKIEPGGSSSAKFGYFDYVGAFWRDDQIGERVITSYGTGPWRAEVVSGQEWLILGPGKSSDKNIYTAQPGDAENFPVEGEAMVVDGVGYIFFRIGAKSKNPNPGQPRYGRILVTAGTDRAYVYARQGEDADYLMRPEDFGTSDSPTGAISWATSEDPRPRPRAAKFLPLNLTSSNDFAGGTSMSNHGYMSYQAGALARYPTHAGVFFGWAQNQSNFRVYHPVNPNKNSISSWYTTYPNQYWNLLWSTNEGCPDGYRRPQNGDISKNITSLHIVDDSETYQSLWADPTTITGSNSSKNAQFGYYADGFFDRRKIEHSVSYNGTTYASVVNAGNLDVGYVGLLFFNPNTDANNSLFFPTPGYRHSSGGTLYNSGNFGYYWTGTSSSSSGHHISIQYITTKQDFQQRAGSDVTMKQINKAAASMIRCVKGNYD